jgi:dTDP-glucose pyrophosphorylase
MKKTMKNILIGVDSTIRKAMKALDKTTEKCLLVIDEGEKLIGTITDGDIRRAILSGIKVSDSISECYNSKPITMKENNFNQKEVMILLKENKIDLIPILDDEERVKNYSTWTNIYGKEIQNQELNNIPVVIMAGGKGTRMEPFTKILPKPLIPINEKPIIEHIIEQFTDIGCSDFYLSLNYKSKILKAYFEELDPSYNVNYIEEAKPLGTAGSLKLLIDKFKSPFFVTNCDIIIKKNYSKIFEFHKKRNYDLTLVASAKEYQIPYGSCNISEDGTLESISEKPSYDLLVNTGLYILNPSILDLIPKDEFYHITNLIDDLIKNNYKVGVFPIDEDAWIDIGEWSEYKKALSKL